VPTLGPRLVVTGVGSGAGKTTVATGLMAALVRRGLRTGSAKVGPDFIDPGYHSVATGRQGRTLDAWLSGEALLAPLAAAAGADVDVLVIEGVMGAFDSSGQPEVDGSTAEVARALECPVIVVVDVWTMAETVAAVVHGVRTLGPGLDVAGVVLNRVAGEGHAALCRRSLEPLGVPVIGAIPNDDRLAWRERHLGLVPVAEHRAEVARSVERIAGIMEATCDLEALERIARSAPARRVPSLPAARPVAEVRLAVASGPAFSFVYPENLALFEQAGAELFFFDPLAEPALPYGCDALYAGGGFPEVFSAALSANAALLESVRRAVAGGVAVWAECGGFLWLGQSLDAAPMAAVLPAAAHMTDRLTIGYRAGTTTAPSPLGPAGTMVRGHEFHHAVMDPPGHAVAFDPRFGCPPGGYVSERLFAGFLHQHLAATPELAERFVASASRQTRGARVG